MKKRAVLGATALAGALGWALSWVLVSEETRIRGLLQDEVASFNAASLPGCMAGLAADYEDLTARMDRTSLQHLLAYAFNRHRDRESGEFRYWARVPDDRVVVTMKDAARTEAEVEFPVEINERDEPVWTVQVVAVVVRTPDGWLFRSSRHK